MELEKMRTVIRVMRETWGELEKILDEVAEAVREGSMNTVEAAKHIELVETAISQMSTGNWDNVQAIARDGQRVCGEEGNAPFEQLYDGKLDAAVEIMLEIQGVNDANRNS